VAGAAALLWAQVARAPATGDTAARVAGLLRSLALDSGDPGPDARFGLGRTRVETTPPELGASVPAAGAAVGGAIPLRLPLLEAGTLDTAAAWLDGAPLAATLGADRALTASFDSRTVADGIHHVQIAAADKSGNAAHIDLPFRIDNTPPTLGRTRPERGAPVSGVVRVRIGIVDAGLATTALALDRRPLPSVAQPDGAAASVDTRLLGDGTHTIEIAATDLAGNTATFELPFLVDNTAPAIRIRAPRSARVGARVRVRVAATDALSGLARPPLVTFGDGSATRAATAAHRYRRRGAYRLTVTVSDRAGNVTRRSRPVGITAVRLRHPAR
jgi:hypothetical protein